LDKDDDDEGGDPPVWKTAMKKLGALNKVAASVAPTK